MTFIKDGLVYHLNLIKFLRVVTFNLKYVCSVGQYNYNEAVVLNLAQDGQHLGQLDVRQQESMQQHLQQQYPTFIPSSSLEVGLNLSLQKSYLGQQQHQQQQNQQQNNYYGHFDASTGYTYAIPMTGSNTQVIKLKDTVNK